VPHQIALARTAAPEADLVVPCGDAPVFPAAGEHEPGEPAAAAPRPLLWGGALSIVLVCHLAIGLSWIARAPLGTGVHDAPAETFDLDLAGPMDGGLVEPSVEAAPDVPPPEIAREEPRLATASPDGSPPSHEAPATPSAPPSADATVVVPPTRQERAAPDAERETDRRRERAREERAREERARQERARERAEAARLRAEEAGRRAAAIRPGQVGAARAEGSAGRSPAPASSGASAAASAAWRSQIVAILRSRFAGGSGAGMASVAFSVTRGGQIAGARLAGSSGDPRIDAAALAAFRGPVPPPPAGYVGALSFNIRLGVR
jgi:TonB family protein